MLMQRKIAQETQQEVLELFNIWDESGEGIMEADELRCLLNRIPERLTRKEIDLLVSQADTKKNGKINFEGLYVCSQCKILGDYPPTPFLILHFAQFEKIVLKLNQGKARWVVLFFHSFGLFSFRQRTTQWHSL